MVQLITMSASTMSCLNSGSGIVFRAPSTRRANFSSPGVICGGQKYVEIKVSANIQFLTSCVSPKSSIFPFMESAWHFSSTLQMRA